MVSLASTTSPRPPAGVNALTVRLADAWTLVLERQDDGRVDMTLRSSGQAPVVLIGGYGQHPRVALLDDGNGSDGPQPILQVGSCMIVLPDTATQLAVGDFIGKGVSP